MAWGLLGTVKWYDYSSTEAVPGYITLRGGGSGQDDAPQWAFSIPRSSLCSQITTAVHGRVDMAPVDLPLGGIVGVAEGCILVWRLITGRALCKPGDISDSQTIHPLASLVGAHTLADHGMVSANAKALTNHIMAKYSHGHVIAADVYPFYAQFATYLQDNGYVDEYAMVTNALVS